MDETLDYIIILHIVISSFISGCVWVNTKDIYIPFRILICILVIAWGIELFIVDLLMDLFKRIKK